MTAEIALLNKSAVALAADSAVSIPQGSGYKIFNSVNKLFALSKYAPVGLMIYGSANFMGTPWETFIKLYRTQLGQRRFSRLEDYALDFVRYLKSCPQFFPESTQDDFVQFRVNRLLYDIYGMVDQLLDQVRQSKATLSQAEVRAAYRAVIDQFHEMFVGLQENNECDAAFAQSVFDRHQAAIEDGIDGIIGKKFLTRGSTNKLRDICKMLFRKRFSHPALNTGVVIAGFGEDEIFPSIRSLEMDGFVDSKLLYMKGYAADITHKLTAVVVPFAQDELVQTFMDGVNPWYQEDVELVLRKVISRYPAMVELALPSLPPAEKRKLRSKLERYGQNVLKDVVKDLRSQRKQGYSDPVVQAVQLLPKDELATMAATLVNLTSFKQRMSLDYETVGGPVDVAVISKGDGFIWIQRKHYFEPETNPQFFANYNRPSEPATSYRRNGAPRTASRKRVSAAVERDQSVASEHGSDGPPDRNRNTGGQGNG